MTFIMIILHSLKLTNGPSKSRCICYWNGLMSIAMFVCCRATICVCIFFCIYTYVMSPIFKRFFLFFSNRRIKKKIAWAAISLCCVLSSGLRGSAARIVQEIFLAPKNFVWNGRNGGWIIFSHKTAFDKNIWGKKWVHLPHKISGQKVFKKKTLMSRPPPTVSWVSFWDCRFDSNSY